MQESQDLRNEQDVPAQDVAATENHTNEAEAQDQKPKLKKPNSFKDQFKEKGKQEDDKNKPGMTKEETVKFYEENLPFMRLQDDYEELVYKFNERKVRNLELQVRELEAIGFLGQWKAQQDEAKRRHDEELKMREQWEKMSPEEREEWQKKAQANLKIMDMQAKGEVKYDGTNAGALIAFMTGEPNPDFPTPGETPHFITGEGGAFSFEAPTQSGEMISLTILPGQTFARAEDGNFMIIG